MPYELRVVLAMLGGCTFMAALVLGLGEMLPSPSADSGLSAAALFSGLGFGALCGAFVRR